jgi:hypothetical protein
VGRSVVRRFGALCIALLLAVAPVLAQIQAAAGKAEDIKAMLLGTATWHADWTKPGDSGVSEIVFEARGDKVVAKLVKITPPTMSCEHDVTITTGVVKFDACIRQNVTLRFDPNDREYPFKGNSEGDFEWKLRRK